jgi:type IV pilus assembly protein PilX
MRSHFHHRNQRGAALIIGMILLLVLTLLAVAGMNTASMEFIMAGNHQSHSRAFVLSDAGIETAFTNSVMNPQPGWSETFTGTMANSDSFRAVAAPVFDIAGQPIATAASGSSVGAFNAWHFRIVSEGNSVRGSRAEHSQELFIIANGTGGLPPPITGPGGTPLAL